MATTDVPCVTSLNAVFEKYKEKFVVLYRPPTHSNNTHKTNMDFKSVASIFKESNLQVKNSFCVENVGNGANLNQDIVFANVKNTEYNCWYSSFICQNDEKILKYLNTKLLPIPFIDNSVFHSDIIWFFIGKNLKTIDLEGRPEHTDSVTHDGTWHYQLSGEKKWYIRPTEKLIENLRKRDNNENSGKNDITLDSKMMITCLPGDILLLNTKLWWHHTGIPCTKDANDEVSISYARDIYFHKPNDTTLNDMTNVDAIYASKSIKCGEIVLTEADLPDCELPRSNEPNCEVSMLENGQGALIAIRNIDEGDFFSIANSSSDEDDIFEEADDDGDDNA